MLRICGTFQRKGLHVKIKILRRKSAREDRVQSQNLGMPEAKGMFV